MSDAASSAAALRRLASWSSLEELLPFVAQQTSLQQRRSSHCPRLAAMCSLDQVLPVCCTQDLPCAEPESARSLEKGKAREMSGAESDSPGPWGWEGPPAWLSEDGPPPQPQRTNTAGQPTFEPLWPEGGPGHNATLVLQARFEPLCPEGTRRSRSSSRTPRRHQLAQDPAGTSWQCTALIALCNAIMPFA